MAVLVIQQVTATEERAIVQVMGDSAPGPSVEIRELYDVIRG